MTSDPQESPAANFAGGQYTEVTLADDTVFYRAGVSTRELGQWFTQAPPTSVAQVRIDTAVPPHWIDPATGGFLASSPIDHMWAISIPAGTTVYYGPTANQGGVYVGGAQQVFIREPWTLTGVAAVDGWSIR